MNKWKMKARRELDIYCFLLQLYRCKHDKINNKTNIWLTAVIFGYIIHAEKSIARRCEIEVTQFSK